MRPELPTLETCDEESGGLDTGDILTEVKSLSRARLGCSYYRVDLHVHSPASSDYAGDNNISSYEFVSAFVARGFDLIAITDHNTGAYVDQAITARNEIASKEGKNITILAGVELHVSPGVHLLAILPKGGSAAISDLLSRLGLPIEQHGDTTKLISESIVEITRIVHERNGLLIGAHCNSTNGIVEELDGQTRLQWLRAVDALEFNSGSGEDKISTTISYVTNSLMAQVPFTFGSDSHDSTFDNTGMWVKMADPSFASLRQLVFEPELRVSRTEPIAPAHGRISGFTTTHGIYARERFRFSPHLNTLIGGRGAGKSAAIDLLRFAFEAEPGHDDGINKIFANRIAGFLQLVGEVLVVSVGTDGKTYAITRSGAYEKSSARATPVFTERARVYQVVDENLILREMRPLDVLGIEFYGQGEAARLADRVSDQLRLIDENLDHSAAVASASEAEQRLSEGEDRLTGHNQRLEDLRVEAAKRQHLEERRDRLAESLADPIFADRTRWDRERNWVQGRQDWVKTMLESLPVSMPPRTEVPIDINESTATAVLKKVQEASDRILETGQDDLYSFRELLAKGISELEVYRNEWDAAFEIAETEFRARLAALGASDLAEAAAEKRGVEEKLTQIESIIEPEISQIELAITLLNNERARLLSKLKDARSAIAHSRSAFVDELNAKLGGNVLVDLSDPDTSLFVEAVNTPLLRSGMQHREEQVLLACESFSPEKFAEIIREAAVEQLTGIGITENNASRMMALLTEEVLQQIERVDVPPLPSIRIRREGQTEYTDLSSLSVGEKCSAILSIALLSKGKPLVIDQPEDDLDHAFIIDSIVEGIRSAKQDRQIVAATHNPNIPVLGDAEMVFRVARQAGDDICYIRNSGGLELPRITAEVQSLEGGADAFERRRRRYSGVS